MSYKLIIYAQADQDEYMKILKPQQLKHSIVLPLFIHGEKTCINVSGYSLKQFLQGSDKGIQCKGKLQVLALTSRLFVHFNNEIHEE